MEFGGNDDNHIRGEEALRASVVKVWEVVGAENADTDMITADTMEAMDIPFLSGTTPMLIKRGVDGQDRITYYRLKIKLASNLYRDFFVLMRVCLFFKFFS